MLCLFHPLLLFHFCILHQQMLKHLYPASYLAIFFTFVKDELSAVFPWLFILMIIDLTLAWLRRIRKIYGEEEIRRDFFGVNVRYFFQNQLDVKTLLITSFQKSHQKTCNLIQRAQSQVRGKTDLILQSSPKSWDMRVPPRSLFQSHKTGNQENALAP